jgi:hypothetical protein
MKTFLQVLIFSLLVIGGFGGYSNFGIPQIKPSPPPVAEKIDLGAMDMDSFIALGEKILNGRGTCTLCHNSLGRAPMLDKLGVNIAKRFEDPRNKAEERTPQAYLIESMIDPSAYVVVGFGKAGSKDTESPMPDVSGGSIGLSEVEIAAVTAYMLDSNGMENTVEIPTDAGEAADEDEDEGEQRPAYASAEEALTGLQCGMCHKVGEEEGDVGPDLTKIGATKSESDIRIAILDPNAEVAEGYDADMMPLDYGEQMYAKELEMVVKYLSGLK